MKKSKNCICVINQKGGVGKTTVSYNIGKLLSTKKQKCLLIDNDPQGNLTSSFVDSKVKTSNTIDFYSENGDPDVYSINDYIDIVGADSSLAKISDGGDFDVIYNFSDSLDKVRDNYDYIIIDCVPSFGYLNTAALLASDFVLIPTTADNYSIEGLADLLGKINKINKIKERGGGSIDILGIVLNLLDGSRTIIQKELEEVLRDSYKGMVFNSILNKSTKFAESPAFNQSITEYAPQSKAAKQFSLFMEELINRVEHFSLTNKK